MLSFNSSQNNSFNSPFLQQTIGTPDEIELTKFISSLIPLPPEQIKTIEDFNLHLACISEPNWEFSASSIHYIRNLIHNQFQGIEQCIREIISNALDAHARSGKSKSPIFLTIKGNELTLEDSGDGMGWSSLASFFVPGRSSNPKAIFDLKKGIPEVTGRFGQGALAIFSLMHARPADSRCMPRFFEQNGMPKMALTYFDARDHQTHEIIIDQEMLEHSQRKMFIHTLRDGEHPLKMKFKGIGEEIFLKTIKEKSKEKVGTTFNIKSPLIEANNNGLINSVIKTFKHVFTPIFVNQIQINASDHKTLNVEGGTLFYTPLPNECHDEGGILRVCENRKLVAEFVLEKGFVPKELTVNFDQLPLTHDRSTLDYQDGESIKILEAIIDKIWFSDMNLPEKGALLNGLFPIIGRKQYDLIGKIKHLIKSQNIAFLPDTADFHKFNENQGLYLNLKYISSFNHAPFFEGKNYKLYLLPNTSSKPVASLFKDGQEHIFLNKELISAGIWQCQYNLTLLNKWLKNKGITIAVDVKRIIKQMQFDESNAIQQKTLWTDPSPEIADFIDQFKDIDYQKYDSFSNDKMSSYTSIGYIIDCLHPDNDSMKAGAYYYALSLDSQNITKKIQALNSDDPLSVIDKKALIERLKKVDGLLRKISKQDFDYFEAHVSEMERKIIKYIVTYSFYVSQKTLAFLIEFALTRKNSEDPFLIFFMKHWMREPTTNLKEKFQAYFNFYAECIKLPETLRNHLLNNSENFVFLQEPCSSNYCFQKNLLEKYIEYFKLSEIASSNNQENFETSPLMFGKPSNTVIFLKMLDPLRNLMEANHQSIKTLLFRESYEGKLWHFDWLATITSENLEKFLSVLPPMDLMPKEVEKRLQFFSKVDYENILMISQKEHLSLYGKQIFVKILTLVTQLKNNSICIGINSPNFVEFLLDVIDKKKEIDLNELEHLFLEMQTFTSCTNNINSLITNILIQSKSYKPIKNKPTTEDLLAYLQTKELTPLPNFSLSDSLYYCINLCTHGNKNNIKSIQEILRIIWERAQIISSNTRPYIYAMLSQESKNFISENFKFPISFDPVKNIYLHEDETVLKELFSNKSNQNKTLVLSKKEMAEYAHSRIQSALKQNVTENFFVGELATNAEEAGATQVHFEFHKTEDGKSVLIVKDNGSGMGKEELSILKTPNVTKKIKSPDDPNFGWGFFTVFNDYDEVMVSSSKDGQTTHHLYFKKTEKGILTQESMTIGLTTVGTTFRMMKGENPQPLIDFIKLKSEIFSKCQFIQKLDIQFQGQCLTMNQKPAIFHEERDGGTVLQIGTGDEGIYCNRIRIGDIPEAATRFLPDPLKKMLEKKQIKLRLFLPHKKQIMNRNQMKEEDFAEKTGILIFKALFNFYLKQFLPSANQNDDDLLKILSEDYWNKFEDSFQLREELFSIKQVMEGTKNEPITQLMSKLSDPTLFTQLLVTTPISMFDSNSTFMEIRNQWIYVLVNENFISLEDKTYNSDFIKNCSPEELKNKLDRCMQIVSIYTAEKDREYSKKINYLFSNLIYQRCLGIKQQTTLQSKIMNEIDEDKLPPEAQHLTQFCKQIAERFDRKIEVSYYSKSDGANAYTTRGVDTIFINRLGLLKNFIKIHDHTKPSNEAEPLNEQQVESIVGVIETITHELVHLNEDSACQTHDPDFYNQLGNFLEIMFIRNDPPEKSVLKMLGF